MFSSPCNRLTPSEVRRKELEAKKKELRKKRMKKHKKDLEKIDKDMKNRLKGVALKDMKYW